MKNRFQILLWQKQAEIGREIPLTEIEVETDISRQTLDKYRKNQMKFVNLEVIQALCDYFKCDIADFLYIDRGDQQPSDHHVEAQP